MTTLSAFNPTIYPANRVVRCGSNKELACTNERLSEFHFINVVRVKAEAGDWAEINLEEQDALPRNITFSPSVLATLGAGFRHGLKIDGEAFMFAPHKLDYGNGYTVLESRLIASVGMNQRFIGRLWTYAYHESDIIDTYVHVAYEDLKQRTLNHTVEFIDDTKLTLSRLYGVKGHTLWSGDIEDGQAFSAEGVTCCYASLDGSYEQQGAILQALEGPLLFDVEWRNWGPLSSTTQHWGIHPKKHEEALFKKATLDYAAHGKYLGYINLPDPSTTGAQPEFGYCSSVEGLFTTNTVRRPVLQSYFDRVLARQECYRPNKFMEANGDVFTKEKHPDMVPWDERPHYNLVVSPDQGGRSTSWAELATDPVMPPEKECDIGYEDWDSNYLEMGERYWDGHDREHYVCKRLVDNILRFDDPIAKLELEAKANLLIMGMTLPSEKPGWSTNFRGTGRGQGRTYEAAAYMALGLGYDSELGKKLLLHMLDRMYQCTLANWTGKDLEGPAKVERVIESDYRVFNGEKPGWITWEDAIFVRGSYILLHTALAAGISLLPEFIADIESMIFDIGKTIVWSGTQLLGDRAVQIAKYTEYKPVDGKLEYLTAKQKEDPSIFVPANETDFILWALPAYLITQKLAAETSSNYTLNRCAAIIESIFKQYENRPLDLIRFGSNMFNAD